MECVAHLIVLETDVCCQNCQLEVLHFTRTCVYFNNNLYLHCTNHTTLFEHVQPTKPEPCHLPTPEEEVEEAPPPPIAERPEKTKSIVCIAGIVNLVMPKKYCNMDVYHKLI